MKLRHAFAVGTWAVLVTAVAHAEDWSLATFSHGPRSSVAYESSGIAAHRAKPRRYRGARSAASRHQYAQEEREVRLYRQDDKPRGRVQCQARVRGLGTQWIGEEGALDAARKDWMERVRYDLGEAYLDMSHADDEISRCGRTSVGETMGQVMYRCEIVARPCKAAFGESK